MSGVSQERLKTEDFEVGRQESQRSQGEMDRVRTGRRPMQPTSATSVEALPGKEQPGLLSEQ